MFKKQKEKIQEEYDVITENQKYHYRVFHVDTNMKIELAMKIWFNRLTELEKLMNDQASEGYKLNSMTTQRADRGGTRIQAILVFEKELT